MPISISPNANRHGQPFHNLLASSSNRFSVNWEKVIVVANSALLIAGIAVAFFMELPFLVLGLGAYGTTYLLLQLREKKQPHENQSSAQRKELKKKVSALKKKKKWLDNRVSLLRKELNWARNEKNHLLNEKERASVRTMSLKVSCFDAMNNFIENEFLKLEKDKNKGEVLSFLERLNQVIKEAEKNFSASSSPAS